MFLIQARSTSTRLPNKSLALVNGLPMIEWVIRACKSTPKHHTVIVCIPDNSFEYELEQFVQKNFPDVFIFRGDENNVFLRFRDAFNAHQAELAQEQVENGVVRICADRPLLSPYFLSELTHSKDKKLELLYNHDNLEQFGPIGVGGESLSKTLASRFFSGQKPGWIDKEHVTINLYNKISKKCKLVPSNLSKSFSTRFNLSVDTKLDLELVNRIVKNLGIKPGENLQIEDFQRIERFICQI